MAISTSPTISTTQNEYIPRGRNVLHTIFENHFQDFVDHYEEKHEKNYGKYRLDRVISVVKNFLDCSDYIKAKGRRCPLGYRRCPKGGPQVSSSPQGNIARIRCVNPNCGFDYFVPFSHWRGLRLKRLLLMPILLTKTYSSFLREYGE